MTKEFQPKGELDEIIKGLEEKNSKDSSEIGQNVFSNTVNLKENFSKAKEEAEKAEIDEFIIHFNDKDNAVLEEIINNPLCESEKKAARQILEERNRGSNSQEQADMKMTRKLPDKGNGRTVHESGNIDHDDAYLLFDTKKD